MPPARNKQAALLLIGDELLSGRTQDKNLAHIAGVLEKKGIALAEARITADNHADIIAALNALRRRYDYVFTTGGIGPTHDDITAAAVAEAFDRPLIRNPEAVAQLEAHYARRDVELNEARLRMADMPEGAALIPNFISGAPGFVIDNVYVLAGVPVIMQNMMQQVAKTLAAGARTHEKTLVFKAAEGEIARELADQQKNYPDVKIGSYPAITAQGAVVRVVLRGKDKKKLAAAAESLAGIADALPSAGEKFT